MNPTVLRAAVPDVIAHAMYTIGYRPRESLVVVGLSGPRQRIGLTIRLDLPSAPRARVPLEAALRMLRTHGDTAVVGMVVSDRPDPADRRAADAAAGLPRARFARDVRRRLRAAGFDVLDMLSITTSGWSSYLCRDPLCCPPGGRSLDEVTDSPLAAWHVAQGHVLADDEAGMLAYVDRRPDPRPGDGRATDGEDHRTDGEDLRAGDGGHGFGARTLDHLGRWRRLLAGDDPVPQRDGDVRWLCDALADRRFRDAVLVSLLPGSSCLPDVAILGMDPATFEAMHAAPPDDALLERGTGMLAAVARSAPPGRRAEALALLAWAAWWAGDGVRGRLLAGRALADDPAHTLASLVEQLLLRGVPPRWVRRRAG